MAAHPLAVSAGLEVAAGGEHAAVEVVKAAFERRPALAASGDAAALLGEPLAATPACASSLRGPTGADHTAAVVTADAGGLAVSMLVSVYHEFGSGALVPEAGFVLNDRLSGLIDAGYDPAALPPADVRPPHTLSPMLLELGGRRVALATPGADGQVQTLVQLVRRLEAGGTGLSEVLAVPRWRTVRGRLALEASFDGSVREGLAALGHRIDTRPDGDTLFGAAALAGHGRDDGVVAAADPRRET